MSKSQIEETIGCLWMIAALIAFASGHPVWGYIFAIKAAFDMAFSIIFAIWRVTEDKINGEIRKEHHSSGEQI